MLDKVFACVLMIIFWSILLNLGVTLLEKKYYFHIYEKEKENENFKGYVCRTAVALSLVGCAQTSNSDKELTKVTLMLDYTPNTNHTGFYVAKNKGYYKEVGLDVDIIEPGDNATTSMVAAEKLILESLTKKMLRMP